MKMLLKDVWVNVLNFEGSSPSIYGAAFTERSEAISDRDNQIKIAMDDHGFTKTEIGNSMKTITLAQYEQLLAD